ATGNFQPVIVAYAPTGHRVGKQFALVRTPMDEDQKRHGTRLKMPKLYPGDLAMVSSAGSHVIVDENLHLAGGGLLETTYRSSDLAILTSALQHYVEAADSRVRWGMVERDADFISGANKDNDPLTEEGRPLHYVTSGLDAVRLEDSASATAWVEHRLELREKSQGQIPIPDTLHEQPSPTTSNWLLRSVHGTLVGNDISTALYGKPLIRLVLSSGLAIARSYEAAADAAEETAATSTVHLSIGPSEESPVASADWDKSGRLALSLGKTSGTHPAGVDKSLQIAADGNVEAVFGTGTGFAGDFKFSGDYREDITQDYYSLVGRDSTTDVTRNFLLTIGGDVLTQVSGAYEIQGSTSVKMTAGTT
ncbi:MAG: hypothetical protein Q8P59_08005, partial [Dehalococcoidia bacterium]|nr:hypothetical protein [Dehalococcoidia bacterium]